MHCSALLALALSLASCAVIENRRQVAEPADLNSGRISAVTAPSRVHLNDGSVVVFERGFQVRDSTLAGTGMRHDLHRSLASPVTEIPLASVVGVEYYVVEHDKDAELAVNLPIVTASVVGTAALAKALFGSCPTVYSAHSDSTSLEAELFSYSIGPIFEAFDLDRLNRADLRDDHVRLRVVNEALETHWINSLTLEAVDHATGSMALPTPEKGILLLGEQAPLLGVRDRQGREITELIAQRDGRAYRSDAAAVAQLAPTLSRDWIEVGLEIPTDVHSVVLGLRLRNTLLNTVFLYDALLRPQGAQAVDWLQNYDKNPLRALTFAGWYREHFGMHVSVVEDPRQSNLFIPDSGPIAWHDLAVEIPVRSGQAVHLRLEFLPDNWFIDWLAVSFEKPTPTAVHSLPCREITDQHGVPRPELVERVRDTDEQRFVLYPGQQYDLEFPLPKTTPLAERSWLLRSRGYYVEWIRRHWIHEAQAVQAREDIRPGAALLQRTMQRWMARRETFEREFFEWKVPKISGDGE